MPTHTGASSPSLFSILSVSGVKYYVLLLILAWKAVVSDYDPAQFTAKVQYYIKDLSNAALHASNGAFSMDAIYHVRNY